VLSPQGQGQPVPASPEQHGIDTSEHPGPAKLLVRPRPGLHHGPTGLVGPVDGGWSGQQARLVGSLNGGTGFHGRTFSSSHLVCRASAPRSEPRLGVAAGQAWPSTGLDPLRTAGEQQCSPLEGALTQAQAAIQPLPGLLR